MRGPCSFRPLAEHPPCEQKRRSVRSDPSDHPSIHTSTHQAYPPTHDLQPVRLSSSVYASAAVHIRIGSDWVRRIGTCRLHRPAKVQCTHYTDGDLSSILVPAVAPVKFAFRPITIVSCGSPNSRPRAHCAKPAPIIESLCTLV
jgi:hypothetical protein